MPNFNEALDVTLEDVKAPPKLAVGTYQSQISKQEIIDEHEKYQYLDFSLKILSPIQVDRDEYAAGPTLPATRRLRFLFDKEDQERFDSTLYRVKRFLLDHLKIEASDDTSFKTLLDAAPGRYCAVMIGRRTDKNDSTIEYEDIKRTAPL